MINEAIEYIYWSYHADELMSQLLSSPNRHTRRLYASDLESFRRWLLIKRSRPAESTALMLAIWLHGGREEAQTLFEAYRDHLVQAGKSRATVNRHLCTLRAVARLARKMGRINWDLSGVPNLRLDNFFRIQIELRVA